LVLITCPGGRKIDAPCATDGAPTIFPEIRGNRGTVEAIPVAEQSGERMHELTVIGAEPDALLLQGESGEKFKVSIDESLRQALRGARARDTGSAPRLSPREVQAHIRAGMSASDVASLTGAPV